MNKVAKAVVAALTTLAATVGTAEAAGQITGTQWVLIGAGSVVAGMGVWATTNAPQDPKP